MHIGIIVPNEQLKRDAGAVCQHKKRGCNRTVSPESHSSGHTVRCHTVCTTKRYELQRDFLPAFRLGAVDRGRRNIGRDFGVVPIAPLWQLLGRHCDRAWVVLGVERHGVGPTFRWRGIKRHCFVRYDCIVPGVGCADLQVNCFTADRQILRVIRDSGDVLVRVQRVDQRAFECTPVHQHWTAVSMDCDRDCSYPSTRPPHRVHHTA